MYRRKKTRRKSWMDRWQSSPLNSIANAHLEIDRLKMKLIGVYCGQNTWPVLPSFWSRFSPPTTMSRTFDFLTSDCWFRRGKQIFVCRWILSEWVQRVFMVSFYNKFFHMRGWGHPTHVYQHKTRRVRQIYDLVCFQHHYRNICTHLRRYWRRNWQYRCG